MRDVHFAACPSFGPDGDDSCRGCKPTAARDKALICERCYRSLKRYLDDAPDALGELRSRADPMKSGWNFDRLVVSSSRSESPAPVSSDLIDAADDITRTLRAWALWVQFGEGHPWKAQGLEAGISTSDAFDDAHGCVEVILGDLDRLVNRVEVVALCGNIIGRSVGDPSWWSVADVLARYPLDDSRARWAHIPCPECDMKTVRVHPPRRAGGFARYVCTTDSCEWERTDRDDRGLWQELFAGKTPGDVSAKSIPLGDKDLTSAHDDRWLTLADAARLAKRTTGTVRAWATAGEVRAELGRYWREDVEAVRDERDGVAVVAAPDETKEVVA